MPTARKLGLLWLMLLLATASNANDNQASQQDADCVLPGQVLLPATNKMTDVTSLIRNVSRQHVVLLGEHHDNVEHHRWQLQTITGLHVLHSNIVIGFEMFPRRVQPVLDRWVAGELSEEAFLKETDWAEFWRFDPDLYLPLFNYARMNKIPMVALNVERSLISSVGEKGWENLPVEQREGVSTPEAASQGYRELLSNIFRQHNSNQHGKEAETGDTNDEIMSDPGFNRFVGSQTVWDRAMAEGISRGLKQHEGAMMLAVVGSGHMMYGFGIPEQLNALGISDHAILIPWDPEFECSYINENFADAVIGLQPIRLSTNEEQKPRLGVYLESSDKGVVVTKVMEDSVAKESKIETNDVIIKLAEITIDSVESVIKIVKAMQPGTWLPMTIERNGELIDIIAKFPSQVAKQNNKTAHPDLPK